MSIELQERFDQATARLATCISIAGAIGDTEAISEPMRDFIDDCDELLMDRVFGVIPESVWESIELGEYGDFAHWLIRTKKLGFLVRFETPVMNHHSPRSASFSWGYYMTQWIYGETFDEAIEAGFAWVEKVRKLEKAKKPAKKAAKKSVKRKGSK